MMAASDTGNGSLAQRATWGAVLTVVSVLGTLALACAMPFAALAVMAAIFLPRREALVLIGINWLANQAVGFGLLHYPLNWSCFAGGIELGIAAMSSVAVASIVYRALQKFGPALAVIGTFAAAYGVYEGICCLGAMDEFSAPIALYILYLNGVVLAGLLAVQALAAAVGLAAPRAQLAASVASTA